MSSTDDQISDRAREVFGRPEFHRDKSWVQRFFEWLGRQLERILPDSVVGGTGFSGGFGGVVVWIILIVLLVGLLYAIYRLVRGRVRRSRREPDEVLIEVEEHRSTGEWASAAEEFERDGNWKEALRCRYRELVSALVDRRAVGSLPGSTTGELRVEVTATMPDVAHDFDLASRIFELAWYADVPTGAPELADFRARSARVLAGAVVEPVNEPAMVAA